MAYEPKEWACGDVVTADALNHLEGGVAEANSILPSVTASDNGKVLGVDGGEYKLVEDGFVEYNHEGGGRYYLRKSGKVVEVIIDAVAVPSGGNYSDIKFEYPEGWTPFGSGVQIYNVIHTQTDYAKTGQAVENSIVAMFISSGDGHTFTINAGSASAVTKRTVMYCYGAYKLA